MSTTRLSIPAPTLRFGHFRAAPHDHKLSRRQCWGWARSGLGLSHVTRDQYSSICWSSNPRSSHVTSSHRLPAFPLLRYQYFWQSFSVESVSQSLFSVWIRRVDVHLSPVDGGRDSHFVVPFCSPDYGGQIGTTPVSIEQLYRKLACPPSSLTSYLVSFLVKHKYCTHNPQPGLYKLSD